MFNKKVVDVLTQVNAITNSVILKYPQTVAASESKDMKIMFDISKLDQDEFPEIGLNNSLSEFLSVFKLFPEERNVVIDGKKIDISCDNISSSYISDVVALMDAYNEKPDQFIKTEEVPSVATFELSVNDIKNIKSAAGVFKDLEEVIFTSQDDDMKISLASTNKFNAKSNTFSINKNAQTTKEFVVKIPVDNFKMIPQSDYIIDVKHNSARNSYRILMRNKNFEDFKILMSVKV
jgi:hypothetical protein